MVIVDCAELKQITHYLYWITFHIPHFLAVRIDFPNGVEMTNLEEKKNHSEFDEIITFPQDIYPNFQENNDKNKTSISHLSYVSRSSLILLLSTPRHEFKF